MTEIQTGIEGLIINKLHKYTDHRGWLAELFRENEFPEGFHPAMGYVSMTEPGEARGPHEHRYQTDYFCILGPSVFRIYFWDNRPLSPTFKSEFRIEAGKSEIISILVPPGVVHGYKNIGERVGYIFNAPDKLYCGSGKKEQPDEIRFEDDPDSYFRMD